MCLASPACTPPSVITIVQDPTTLLLPSETSRRHFPCEGTTGPFSKRSRLVLLRCVSQFPRLLRRRLLPVLLLRVLVASDFFNVASSSGSSSAGSSSCVLEGLLQLGLLRRVSYYVATSTRSSFSSSDSSSRPPGLSSPRPPFPHPRDLLLGSV